MRVLIELEDVNNQAVFVPKGKPLNVGDLKRDVMNKDDQMYNLLQSLNVEANTEDLRYHAVILAADLPSSRKMGHPRGL